MMELINFTMNGCEPCNIQRKEFEKNPLNIKMQTIDLNNSNSRLIKKFNIIAAPTLILIDENENLINRWDGPTSVEQINNFIK